MAETVNGARPDSDEGFADAAFIQVSFDAAERAATIEESRIPATFAVRAVIAGEEDERLTRNAEVIHLAQDIADIPVETADHCREGGMRIGLEGIVSMCISVAGGSGRFPELRDIMSVYAVMRHL